MPSIKSVDSGCGRVQSLWSVHPSRKAPEVCSSLFPRRFGREGLNSGIGELGNKSICESLIHQLLCVDNQPEQHCGEGREGSPARFPCLSGIPTKHMDCSGNVCGNNPVITAWRTE